MSYYKISSDNKWKRQRIYNKYTSVKSNKFILIHYFVICIYKMCFRSGGTAGSAASSPALLRDSPQYKSASAGGATSSLLLTASTTPPSVSVYIMSFLPSPTLYIYRTWKYFRNRHALARVIVIHRFSMMMGRRRASHDAFSVLPHAAPLFYFFLSTHLDVNLLLMHLNQL